ncbi:hypothetical protein BU26DRAFT_430929 [Trematosphaeria pertusa]|uniref:Uncharacterized protein n=1 Tax=Trematosphaeria pertusa TaxID=390896 RepID=A0A6A6I8I0_9PLEO|nr:uncharacterized protein BU26DRAFT_430929 [Trematosphaeria pertusa]KAF2246865.1 hypothetical protein BU26DRAFT_430929 [Trematosphaeria pertusa]
MQSNAAQLRSQWSNPGDVLSLLLIIGGDIVQKALAQTTAGRIPPVCFSFGWVAYSFSTLVGVIGDGRLLPPPDYPVKVFNLESSYVRENKNWVIGRILRDNEVFMNKRGSLNGASIRISIYTAEAPWKKRSFSFVTERIWLFVTAAQIAVAVVPFAKDGEWGVFLITLSGIAAAIIAGELPQWNVEKLPLKRKSGKYMALTSGNGSREVMIIYSAGEALDLEELAAGESPRSDRVWEASSLFSAPKKGPKGQKLYHKNGSEMRTAFMWSGLPVGLWATRIVCFCQTIFWIALLITVAGLRSHSWYLVGVGGLGMLQNAVVAAVARSPDRRGLPLTLVDTIVTRGTMDGLMDLEMTINGAGQVLLDEFFPRSLRENELAWWSGDQDPYDNQRMEHGGRGRPRSRLPRKNIDIPDIDTSGKARLYRRSSSWESSVLSGDMELRTVSPPPIPRDFEPGANPSAKRPEVSTYSAQESPRPQLPARNDRRAKRSEDSVRSPDWA